jgi:hypothetical protein
MQPPDQAVDPPSAEAFSTTQTRAPPTAAVSAALNPAAPDPMTNTSGGDSGKLALGEDIEKKRGRRQSRKRPQLKLQAPDK